MDWVFRLGRASGAALMGLFPMYTCAASLQLMLQTSGGEPFSNAVVWLTPAFEFDAPVNDTAAARMVQKNRQFIPHILVVQRGAQVSFPNQDDIKHHVFSFSAAKAFEFKVYKDEPPAPLTFDKSGEVELGCNIHDWMLGYVKVVDSPFFDKSNLDGQVRFRNLPEGEYTVSVWHPRILNDISGLQQIYTVSGDEALTLTIQADIADALDDYEKYDQEAIYP